MKKSRSRASRTLSARKKRRNRGVEPWTIYGGIEAVDVPLPRGRKRTIVLIRQYVVFSESDVRLLAKKYGSCHAVKRASGRFIKKLRLGKDEPGFIDNPLAERLRSELGDQP